MKKNKLNILYTCDNNYLPLASISMASIISNNSNANITFYIATETANNEIFENIVKYYSDNKNIEIKYLDCTKYDALLEEKKVDKWGSSTYYVYRRLFAYDLLDVDYVWYIDTDILCLSKIINPQLSDGKVVGAIIDCAHADYNKIAHIPEDFYFYNTGTMFVDVNEWKNKKCTSKIIQYIENIKYKPLMCDQDIISVALEKETEPLDNKYNYFAGYDYYGVKKSFKLYSLDKKPFYSAEEIEKSRNEVIFYHCLEGVFGRPWQEENISPIKKEFEIYRSMSAYPQYKTGKNKKLVFRIERLLEKLPDFIYVKIHNFAQRIFLKRLSKKA